MRSDPLDDLLTRTDTELPPRPAAGNLAERIRARAARRTKVHFAGALLIMVVASVITLHVTHRPPRVAGPHPPSAVPLDVLAWRAELARLDGLAALHRRTANEIEEIRRGQAAREQTERRLLSARDPLGHLAEARDRAARILLLEARRLESMPNDRSAAQADYRRAMELFPETAAAHEAADRLRATGA